MGRITRLTAAGFAALATLALTACWPVPGQNADRTGYNAFEQGLTPETVGDLHEVWSAEPGVGLLPVLDPVVSRHGVHVSVDGCGVVTYDARTGDQRWAHAPFPGAPETCSDVIDVIKYGSPPFVLGDQVLAGTFWWYRPAPTPQFGIQTDELSASNGSQAHRWSWIIGGARGDTGLFVYPLLIGPGASFGYEPYFSLAAVGPLDRSAPLRSIRVATAPGEQDWDAGIPTLGTDLLFHAGVGMLATEPGPFTTGQAVRAFSAAEERPGCGPLTGPAYDIYVECPVWATPIDGPAAAPPVIGPGQSTVYVGTGAGTVYALDAATGDVQWTAPLGVPVTAAPALAEGTLYVPTADGRVVALPATGCDAATCEPLWVTDAAAGASTVQPAVAGGVVYTGAADGALRAYAADGCGRDTCPPLWTTILGTEITGAPAVSNGQLYVGTADGRLLAYGLD